ncbi:MULTISPECIES: L-threonylcarbamoyladenylate synthase [unclassified Massilia]|uniref:L-threonylcarbamoyladenylate synthase n=1 Tax=unclassified Massilia TaxID=2609279 RepID=UPI001B82A504|nr:MULTISPECIES: L-threonylcarbamoyladenylate synthase [unclassified Massilia]MBQ5939331.1 threonylcarbamoyl-AMP synthase [Massilia sp. AB1]MBQ5961411.1 threonylcarbamoyl-AMP synthase [Massilia sp. ZL223]
MDQQLDHSAIDAAARALEQGALVAFPTETVYGLGADAENPAAVAAIYAAKGRPQDHPVIVHLAPGAPLHYWASEIPQEAHALAEAFWPGPLTMILKRAANIPDAVSGGQDTVGLRCPSHPVAIALLRAFKGGRGGVAAPSANKFGHVSPTLAQHVRDEFGADGSVAMVLDGGASQVGIESTIVDLSRLKTHGPVLLRPGHISAEAIAAVIDQLPAAPDAAAPRASGTLESHYAPHTPVAMQDSETLRITLADLARAGRKVALIHYTDMPATHAALRLPATPDGFAHALYAALRAMDGQGADVILVEAPPTNGSWLGVNDRLRRAAHGSTGIVHGLLNRQPGA